MKMTESCEQEQSRKMRISNSKGENDSWSSSRSNSNSSSSNNNTNKSSSNNSGSRSRLQTNRISSEQQQLAAYIPSYLKSLVFPYHGEYCCTPVFNPHFIAQLMAEGFLPVATRGMLLPKLHNKRSVISLPHGLHVSKSVRKKSKRFSITISTQFDAIIQGCHNQHGEHCWLYPDLVAAFRAIFKAGGMDAHPINERTGEPFPDRLWTVRLYTVEVWNEDTGDLAGGELGYTVGSIYTSLTGFTREDSAGSIQLAALGRLLSEKGFHLWDMGMHMEYKSSIGAEQMPRDIFLSEVHRVRESHCHLVLPAGQPAQNCKEVINQSNPQQPSKAQAQQKKMASKSLELKQQVEFLGNSPNQGTDNVQHFSEQLHTPPQSEAEAPIKKRARKREDEV